MNYQLFDDGTMNLLVNGRVERRRYSISTEEQGGPLPTRVIEPELKEGEKVLRTMAGGISIISFRSEA